MSIQKTTTDLSALKINVLTEQMYKDALSGEEIEANELYMTPFDCGYVVEGPTEDVLFTGTYEVSDYYSAYGYDCIMITFSSTAAQPKYINSNYLKITLNEDIRIMSRIDNDGLDGAPYACYGRGYEDAVDWSDLTFCLHLYDSEGTKVKTDTLFFYLKPDYFTSPVTVTIEDYSQTVTTTPDFNAAVSHVLETNLQSVEGGSY